MNNTASMHVGDPHTLFHLANNIDVFPWPSLTSDILECHKFCDINFVKEIG